MSFTLGFFLHYIDFFKILREVMRGNIYKTAFKSKFLTVPKSKEYLLHDSTSATVNTKLYFLLSSQPSFKDRKKHHLFVLIKILSTNDRSFIVSQSDCNKKVSESNLEFMGL